MATLRTTLPAFYLNRLANFDAPTLKKPTQTKRKPKKKS